MMNQILEKFYQQDWDTDDISFNPCSSMYHYRSPIVYAEMLQIISELQMNQIGMDLSKSVCFAVQIDGRMDRQQVDSKFVTSRYVPNDEVSVKNIFIGVTSSDKDGAEGLLDALCSSIEMVTPKQGP